MKKHALINLSFCLLNTKSFFFLFLSQIIIFKMNYLFTYIKRKIDGLNIKPIYIAIHVAYSYYAELFSVPYIF